MNTKYDAIVIGSGIGGLTTAALMAKAQGKKVLVLEKHWVVGGLTHEFERKRKYSWDVGVHYIGQIEEDHEPTVQLFKYITEDRLKWDKITDPYDKFVYPDMEIGAFSDLPSYKKQLIKLFPDEEKAIHRYFKDIKKGMKWAARVYMQKVLPKWITFSMKLINKALPRWQRPLKEYLDQNFKDQKLRAILASQWGDYGVPPSKSPFFVHALVVGHYLGGGYYPRGGAKEIAKSIVPVIERAGGKVITGCEVRTIMVKEGKAVGCSCLIQEGKRSKNIDFQADAVISSVGAYNTYRKLLKNPIHPEIERPELRDSLTGMTLYLGLKDSPETIGQKGGNVWAFDGYDHDKMVENTDPTKDELNFGFVSFPSLKDRTKKHHTAEIIVFTKYDYFKKWANTEWQDRGAEYEALKEQITEKMLTFADKKVPGLRELVEFSELSTPLSIENFTSKPNGLMYGLPPIKERFDLDCLGPKTKIKNLYLSGGDVFILGIFGAIMGGAAAAGVAGGSFGFVKMFGKAMKEAKARQKKQKSGSKEEKPLEVLAK